MVQVIEDMPPGTLGFRVSGRLTREDYAGVLVPPLRHAERIAVVTDLDWLWRAFQLFSWMVPGEMRLFHEGEIDLAQSWLSP